VSASTHMRPRRFVVIDLVSRYGQAPAIYHASEGCSTLNWETSDAALDPPKDTVSLSVPQIVSNSSTILGSAFASHTNCEWAKEYLRSQYKRCTDNAVTCACASAPSLAIVQ
jgi:hypothetical protein